MKEGWEAQAFCSRVAHSGLEPISVLELQPGEGSGGGGAHCEEEPVWI